MKELEIAQQQLEDSVEFYRHISHKQHPPYFDIGAAWKSFLSQQEAKVSNFWENVNKDDYESKK